MKYIIYGMTDHQEIEADSWCDAIGKAEETFDIRNKKYEIFSWAAEEIPD